MNSRPCRLWGSVATSAALGLSAVGEAAAQAVPAKSHQVEGVTVKVRKRTPLTGIDVTGDWCPKRPRGIASGPPRVLASYPREGDTIPGGPVTLSLTFDQPMHCGWAMSYGARDDFCTQIGEWDVPGRRTWSMRCILPAGGSWTVRFDAVNGHGFTALSGPAAAPFTLSFATAHEAAPATSATVALAAEPARVGRLVCPEHRLRGAGPRCRYVPDTDESATPSGL